MHHETNRNARLCIAAAMVATAASSALAADPEDFNDSFNDYCRSRVWTPIDIGGFVQPREDRGRLGFSGARNMTATSLGGFMAEGWRFDATAPFQFSVDLNFVVGRVSNPTGDIGLMIGLYENANMPLGLVTDGVQFHFGRDNGGVYRGRQHYTGGTAAVFYEPAGRRHRGTVYVDYDGAGTIGISSIGYGPQEDTLSVSSVFDDSTMTAELFLGAYSGSPRHRLSPGRAWFDDLDIVAGTMIDDPYTPPADDANGDTTVDARDVAQRFEDGSMTSELLATTLASAGYPSGLYTQIGWNYAMRRFLRDVRTAYSGPRSRNDRRIDRMALRHAFDPEAPDLAGTAVGDRSLVWLEVDHGDVSEDTDGDGTVDIDLEGMRTFDLYVGFTQANQVNYVRTGPGLFSNSLRVSTDAIQHPFGNNVLPDSDLFASNPCLEFDSHMAIDGGTVTFVPQLAPDPEGWNAALRTMWWTSDTVIAQMDAPTFGDNDFYVHLLRITVPEGSDVSGQVGVGVTLFGSGFPWVFNGLDVPELPEPADP